MPSSTTPREAGEPTLAPCARQRLHLEIRGAVQGVGFRPFTFRLARELGLSGWVINDPRGVDLEIEGSPTAVEAFRDRLERERPPLAAIHEIRARPLPARDRSPAPAFEIRTSRSSGERTAVVLPDAATCPECLADVLDPTNRRHGYPFTNCTHCGPRFTIVRSLPYDRPNTTMSAFPLCPACRAEYGDPLDRRFHAQPVACPECGPSLRLLRPDGSPVPGDPLEKAAEALRDGAIVGLKGLGGYQLLVDARREEVVARLRRRKHREEKPFAIMVEDLDAARRLCQIPADAADLLTSVQAPIVLLERRPEAPIAAEVAPGNRSLGVMLPTTPLHHLLLRRLGFPVVATSGNRSDEPIAITDREAQDRLGGIADLLLAHDRPIERHADDSVVRILRGKPRLLRRARGYAPMPVVRDTSSPTILAVGAHLKNVVALSVDRNVYLSQHLGDMETAETLDAFDRVVRDFLRLYEATVVAVAHDLHPDYASTRAARILADELAARHGRPVPLVPVQHHHAHLASCLADTGDERPALGIAWDGTGYGTDGTIWGGELLLGDAASYRRVGRLRPFRLPGGDAAVREPRRAALALLRDLLGPEVLTRHDLAPVVSLDETERRLLGRMLDTGWNAPVTTSAGRLFDGVAALLGLHQRVSFEGQAAMALEQLAETAEPSSFGKSGYPFDVTEASEGAFELDWRPLLAAILEELAANVPRARIARRFHASLARAVAEAADVVGEERVALTGGCFQNRLLTEWTAECLERRGHRVLLHRSVPPNDGGIALGQVAVAAAALQRERTNRSEDEPCA